jgi:S1-C subfamily serine protease
VELLQVTPSSPAAEAGFKDGDLLLSLAGKALPNALTLQRTLRGMQPGIPVEAKIARGGDVLTCSVKPREP